LLIEAISIKRFGPNITVAPSFNPQFRLGRIEGFETKYQQRDLSAFGGLGPKDFFEIASKNRFYGSTSIKKI